MRSGGSPRCVLSALRRASPLGMIGLGHGRAEVGHDSVAYELVERAAGGEDRLDHTCMALVEHGDHLVTGERLAQGGEVADVAEEDGYFAALSCGNGVAALVEP